jgi:hypothetical protein
MNLTNNEFDNEHGVDVITLTRHDAQLVLIILKGGVLKTLTYIVQWNHLEGSSIKPFKFFYQSCILEAFINHIF